MHKYEYIKNRHNELKSPFHDFAISVVHILPQCSPLLKKGLRQEFYMLNNRCRIKGERVVLNIENPMQDFYGKRINVQAIVGVNGSGKSSLLEIIYRIINNLSCLLSRGKRRNAAESLYYVEGLFAEIYYVIDERLARISCLGNKVIFHLMDEKPVVLTAFEGDKVYEEYVLMENFVEWARNNLFYTIVTNYSLQAFNANDYFFEECHKLKIGEKKDEFGDNIWINSLFHKNDGYMTPIVLNPYRDNGVIDMNREHRLTIYRLAEIMIYAEKHQRDFMEGYRLHTINYRFDGSYLDEKFIEENHIAVDKYRNYKVGNNQRNDIGTLILHGYGMVGRLDFNDMVHRTAGMYLIYKTLSIASKYPAYEEFAEIGNLSCFQRNVDGVLQKQLIRLVHTILRDKSHITLKIRQALHFTEALLDGNLQPKDLLNSRFPYDWYMERVAPDKELRSMRDIQEYLPPSFFTTWIEVDRFVDGRRMNEDPIPIERLSSGERQYLYMFSTYIYHILNLLSIQGSHRVKYRRINLVLDEVEICFHPEYQRKFVNELLGYIKRLYMNRNASFNIIIATHSPFILSDIPQCNILYLEDGCVSDTSKFKNPFAANICDILYQSFFLKNGFVGEYARRKINDLIARLSPKGYFTEKWEEQLGLLMEMIGDPFLKMQLLQLYEDRRNRHAKNRD